MTIGSTTDDREGSEEVHVEVRGWCNVGSSIAGIGVKLTISPFGNYYHHRWLSSYVLYATLPIEKYELNMTWKCFVTAHI